MADHPWPSCRPLQPARCRGRLPTRPRQRHLSAGAATAPWSMTRRRPVARMTRGMCSPLVRGVRRPTRTSHQRKRWRRHHARALTPTIRAMARRIAIRHSPHDSERSARRTFEVINRHLRLLLSYVVSDARDARRVSPSPDPANTACRHCPSHDESVRRHSDGCRSRRSAWATTTSHTHSECRLRR